MSFTVEVYPQEKIVTVEVEGALDNTIRMKIDKQALTENSSL